MAAFPGEDIYVSDYTDWLETPLASLAPVEHGLRCQVCKDFFKTPMITSCSHTFCSLCIRHCLSTDSKCPICRATEQASKLRTNWVMEELVDAFQTARPIALEYARMNQAPSKKRKTPPTTLGSGPEEPQRKTRASSRLNAKSQDISKYTPPVEDRVDGADEDYQPEAGIVFCPICNGRVKLDVINSHLDRCTSNAPKNCLLSNPISIRGPSTSDHRSNKPVNKLERLPEVSYSLFKDNALRRKMAELGISTAGNRTQLEQRHKEWLNLWNANCDATRPRRKADLLQDLAIWERTQGIRAPSRGSSDSGSQISNKDFDAAGWSMKHDQSYQQLITNAQRRPGRDAQRPVPNLEQNPVEIGQNPPPLSYSETSAEHLATTKSFTTSTPLIPSTLGQGRADTNSLGNPVPTVTRRGETHVNTINFPYEDMQGLPSWADPHSPRHGSQKKFND